jgi:head-tail adaptor
MATTPSHLFTQRATIQRSTMAADTSGFPKLSWANHLTNVPFRFAQMSGAESLRYGRESTRRSWKCFCASKHDITEDDRIVFDDDTSGGTAKTRTLDIQEIRNPHLLDVMLSIVAEETE